MRQLGPWLALALCACGRDYGFLPSVDGSAPADASRDGAPEKPDGAADAGDGAGPADADIPCPEACGAGSFCDRARGSCAPCPSLGANPADVFVDVAVAGGSGTQACPFPTLAQGIEAAAASEAAGRTVHVAKGIYAAGARAFVVRGFTVEGAGAGQTIVEGAGDDVRDAVNGSRPSPGGEHYRSAFVVGHPTAKTRISGLTLRSTDAAVQALAIPILCDQGNAPAMRLPTVEPNTVLSNLEIVGPSDIGVAVASWTKGFESGCNARVVGSRFTRVRIGVSAYGCYGAVAGSHVALQVGDGTDAGANTFEKAEHPDGQPEYGAFVTDCVSTALFTRNVFREAQVGVTISQSQVIDAQGFVWGRYEIVGNQFDLLSRAGAQLQKSAVTLLTDNSFTRIQAPAGATEPAVALELVNPESGKNQFPYPKRTRNNRFIGNDVGVLLKSRYGINLIADGYPFVDFGNATDPGNNVFRCNSTPASQAFVGGDVVLDATAGGTFKFQGNRWDHAPPSEQTANPPANDPAVNGADIRRKAAGSPVFDTAGAAVATEPCPGGQVVGP